MKIGATTKVSSSSHGEMTINTMEKRKMNSSSPESTYSSIISEHRNDDNEVNFLDDTVDERDTNSPTLSFETAATDNVGQGGCGLFIHQVSNRFDTDRRDRSTVISDMVDNIEEELHERFFARRYSDEESSVDTLNEDTQDTFEDDGQDVTVDSNMPSVTSTTVSSKTSTIRQSKSLDNTDNTTGAEEEQSIKVKEEGPQDTFVSVEEVEESQAKNRSWFEEFFSSNAIVNVEESTATKEKEEEVKIDPVQANEDEQRSSSKDLLSRVKEVSALVAEVFNLPLSIIDEEKSTTDQEENTTVQEKEPAAVPVAMDIFAVESSSTIDSVELSVFRSTDIPTIANDTEENKARLLSETKSSSGTADDIPMPEEKVSKQKKRLMKIPKKIRSISRRLFANTKTA